MSIGPKIVVALCTRQRPRMLRNCLGSLFAQKLPSNVEIAIVVVENDSGDACRGLVEEMARTPSAPPIIYAHEPEIGIPIARNRSLDLALERDPDWIAFIDDDEIADPDWIANFAAAASGLEADVLQGRVVPIYPKATPRWLRKEAKRRATGTSRRTAYTNNTLMRASIARTDGLGLRFDESMRFTGGSDQEFFNRAAAHGVAIRWVHEAVVKESVPIERTSLRWQLERWRRIGANTTAMDAVRTNRVRALARASYRSLRRIATSCLMLPVGLALYPVSPRLGGSICLRALRQLWWSAGSLGAAIGVRPQPYRKVEGH